MMEKIENERLGLINKIKQGIYSWNMLIVLRFYVIFYIGLFIPLSTIMKLQRITPISLIMFGTSILIALATGFFEERTGSDKFVQNSNIVFLIISSILIVNIFIGMISSILHGLLGSSIINGVLFAVSLCFLALVPTKGGKLLEKINKDCISAINRLNERRNVVKHGFKWIHEHPGAFITLIWIIFCIIISVSPFEIYRQPIPANKQAENHTIGFWTSCSYLTNEGGSSYINDTLMDKMSDSNGYFILGCRADDEDVLEAAQRCKDHNVGMKLYRCPLTEGDSFANIWTIENLIDEMEEQIIALNDSNYIGDPVTGIVYDMEGMPDEKHFPMYASEPEIVDKLHEYYEMQSVFRSFNERMYEEYGLNICICTDYFQRLDNYDYDDDISFFWGVMDDPAPYISWSHMCYRKDFLGYDFLLDYMRFLDDGDTIILNSWKYEDCFCYNDIDCLIEECKLILGYPGKNFNLEFWAMRNFLPSYDLEGLDALLDAFNSDRAGWTEISIYYDVSYSLFWDIVQLGVSFLDMFGPLLRVFYLAL